MTLLIWWEKFKKYVERITQPHKENRLKRYLFPFLLIFLLIIFDSITGDLHQETPLLLLTFIIILSAWYGGFVPGLIATALTAIVSNYLFLAPRFSFTGVEGTIATLIFILQGIVISMISEAKRLADTQKDEFISFASHELKNPLAVSKGYMTIIQRMSKDKKILEYINRSSTNIDKVTDLINELLDVTKIESGKLSLHKESIDVDQFIQNVIRDQQLLTHTHKILLTGKTKKRIYIDETRINQVISNMITNAIKYSPGKKKVEISILDKKSSIIVSVKDYGMGLSHKEQQKVFDRYYRAGNAKAEGLGLGLYISLMIVNLHNGRLWVTSEKGKGSTFYLELPI